MKLLLLTQSLDKKNSVLGFFHRWVEELAKRNESVTVICLEKGEYNLPQNVKVLSLGKESKASKPQYILNFYKYILSERNNYDAVFVHMNQEYVLLGALPWILLGKKITMWRNHHAGNFLTNIACYICDTVFCTSKFSYTAQFKNTVLMPVGIDTEFFKPISNIQRNPNTILFLGRIAPVKKPHLLIDALKALKGNGCKFHASFYGDALPKDRLYYESLKKRTEEYDMINDISFEKGVPNEETPHIYNTFSIFVNLSSSGMYDKTIFEAMSSGCLLLASNDNLKGQIDSRFIFEEDNVAELGEKLRGLLSYKNEEMLLMAKKLQSYTEENHSLKKLGNKLDDFLK